MSFGVEEHFVLRLPEKQGKELASAIDSSRLRKRLKINMNGTERSGECRVHLDDFKMMGKLVELPCVTEVLKTKDKKVFCKLGDLSGMVVCAPATTETGEKTKVDSIAPTLFPHGLTPPLKNVRKNRFRKTAAALTNIAEDQTRREVQHLLDKDAQAAKTTFEEIYEDDASVVDDVAKMSDFDSFNVATTVNVEAVATTGGSVHPGDTMHPGGGTSAAGDLACSDDDDDGTASVISAAVSQAASVVSSLTHTSLDVDTSAPGAARAPSGLSSVTANSSLAGTEGTIDSMVSASTGAPPMTPIPGSISSGMEVDTPLAGVVEGISFPSVGSSVSTHGMEVVTPIPGSILEDELTFPPSVNGASVPEEHAVPPPMAALVPEHAAVAAVPASPALEMGCVVPSTSRSDPLDAPNVTTGVSAIVATTDTTPKLETVTQSAEAGVTGGSPASGSGATTTSASADTAVAKDAASQEAPGVTAEMSEAEQQLVELDKRIEALRDKVANQNNPALKIRFSGQLDKLLKQREEFVA